MQDVGLERRMSSSTVPSPLGWMAARGKSAGDDGAPAANAAAAAAAAAALGHVVYTLPELVLVVVVVAVVAAVGRTSELRERRGNRSRAQRPRENNNETTHHHQPATRDTCTRMARAGCIAKDGNRPAASAGSGSQGSASSRARNTGERRCYG